MGKKNNSGSGTTTMLINVVEPEESRIAVIDDNRRLEELYIDRTETESYLGNIYKGRVVSVEPSIQAAFVDFGADKNGFLHASDIMPAYGRSKGNGSRRRRNIQKLVKRGQEVLVQISKDQIGTKVPTLTTYLSLPGRYLVLMPSITKRGVSKKIDNEKERTRLRRYLDEINPPENMGYIVRTAGANRTKSELAGDLEYLLKLWSAITSKVKKAKSPSIIYQESDIVIRTIRDIFSRDVKEIVIDEPEMMERVRRFLGEVMPPHQNRVRLYEGAVPLFHKYGIEDQIEHLFDRNVPLKTGGSIVIEQTEALVAIDVNSGKFKDEDNLEETAYRTNLEAAREIVRQLRLRDLGGVIVCDFIDMREAKHRRAVEREFKKGLKKDRARTRPAPMSKFCLIELTRQRVRQSMVRRIYTPCPVCGGAGTIKTVESMSLHVLREIKNRLATRNSKSLEISCNPDVAKYLKKKKKQTLDELRNQFNAKINIRSDKEKTVEELKI